MRLHTIVDGTSRRTVIDLDAVTAVRDQSDPLAGSLIEALAGGVWIVVYSGNLANADDEYHRFLDLWEGVCPS